MRRRRLLAVLAIASAIVAAGAAAQFDEVQRRTDVAGTAASSASPLRARDVAIAPTSSHHAGIFGVRVGRSNGLQGLLGSGAAILAGALLLAALLRRRVFLRAGTHGSRGHGSIPLGRGPPAFAAT